MARLLHYAAHPSPGSSSANRAMLQRLRSLDGITSLDLYSEYPRYDIDIEDEQERLLAHDVVVLQFPLFWYSCPALVKEWLDLVWEHGFAYGQGGDKLKGKVLQLAVTTGGPQDAYSTEGYQHYELRTFLTPFEQAARLAQMRFLAPYVLHGALRADPQAHALGFLRLMTALRDDRLDLMAAQTADILTHDTLPLTGIN
jgi:Putative NADPH-quinone reductase (modulator of drug activity B)